MRHEVLQITELAGSVFRLRLKRNGLAFEPGQYLNLGKAESLERREYTIYSSPEKDYLEFLIKDIAGGDVSGQLHRCAIGEELEVTGPFGNFIIPATRRNDKFLFVATGTGIAPFHSFAESYPALDYLVLHGVPSADQLYGRESFAANRHVACLSRSTEGQFHGRVTEYLRQHPVDPSSFCYLCGNSDMIYQVFEILQNQGIPRSQSFAEVYY